MLRARERRRRRLSLTSLIDVIFLLLLFFMLSSTFTRFAELPIAAAAGAPAPALDAPPLFVRLTEDGLTLNGTEIDLRAVPQAIAAMDDARTLLVSLADGVTAQRLTDFLVVMRPLPDIAVTVLE
ncbi:MAG: biopolymer transporter ExbD [Pseudomonadota bacterium]